MKIIEPYIEVPPFNGVQILKNIERAGRVCYKSEDKITAGSFDPFVQKIMSLGHHSIFEHEKITVRIVCDRGVTHEIVRHRLAAYSQESTRYCNYSQDKFGREITVINPFFFNDRQNPLGKYALWKQACEFAESSYFSLLDCGVSPQEARSVLPNSLKTEIVVTYNLREWAHFFNLRADGAAHPQMRQIAIPLLQLFKKELDPLFNDIDYVHNFNPDNYAEIKWMES